MKERLRQLWPVTVEEVVSLLARISDKSSRLDALPTKLLKGMRVELAPFIASLANVSFLLGKFPTELKHAQVTPILKKPGLPVDDPASYRPISNLNSISKILERLVLKRLREHLTESPNTDDRQSAYVPGRSTETSLIWVMDDLHGINDQGSAAMLISLDLSAAFDCIDHTILLRRLQLDFGVTDVALAWFGSFLSDRLQKVVVGKEMSSVMACRWGVRRVRCSDLCSLPCIRPPSPQS